MCDSNPKINTDTRGQDICVVNFQTLFNTIDDLMFITNTQGKILQINKAVENRLGFSLEELQGISLTDLPPPERREEAAGIISEMFTGKPGLCSLPLMSKDGSIIPVETRVTPGQWNNQDVLFCVSRDLTSRKHYERALELSERRYQAIVEDQVELICRFLPDTTHTFVNQAYCRYYGKSRDDLIGEKFLPTIYKPDHKKFLKHIDSLSRANPVSTIEHRVVLPDNSVRWQQWTDRAIYNEHGLLVEYQSVGRDITEQKQAEETLKADRHRLFSLLERLPAFVLLIAPDYSIHFTNINYRKRFGEVKGRLCYEVFNNLSQPCSNCPTQAVYQTGTPVEFEWVSPGGDAYQVFDYPFHDIDGTLLVLELMVDITERKHMEEKLRLSEEKFFKAFNSSPALMTILALKELRCHDINENCQSFTGYRREEIIGKSIKNLDMFNLDSINEVLQKVQKHGKCCNYELTFRRKSGEFRTGLLSLETFYLDSEQYVLCVLNDITDIKKMEKEMARLDRLNLVGEMAAIIAHEIRNPLTTVKGFLQLLNGKDRYVQDKMYLELMIDELERTNLIITEFLSLAKNKAVELKKANLNSILKSIIPLIEAEALKHNKKIYLDLGDIPDLLLDKKEIHQVVHNLTRNGLDAMPPDSTLLLRTYKEGDEVILAVHDQGKGIEPDVLEKLGTPFFTTKESGTGLGLAVCYSIAARHNAAIEIKTGAGGTTFYVKFKCVSKT
ncbi:PAS domain S-box protein [Pelotomaculum propionicicum]|uniref:PAS domain S-box protein n=1 Tax=Pelotomaculum propionicicum TaxID=258475 RepID=UPI003B80B323